MKNLTDRQREILEFISESTEANGFPPTIREISENFGISLRAVQDHVVACQKKGFLSQSQKRSRSFRVIKDEFKKPFTAKVPLVGDENAVGGRILCEENINKYIDIAEPFVQPGKSYFAMHVRGESMINAGILDGDLAVIEQAQIASEGQIVAAVVNDSITLKRFFRDNEQIRLQSENPEIQPIYTNDAQIEGVMVGLVRKY
jgi:repressor LexA